MLNLLWRYKVIICFSLTTLSAATPYHNLFKTFTEAPRSSIKGIDAICVINLDSRPERRHRLEPLFDYYGVDYCRFPAVAGLDFDIPTIKKYCTLYMGPGQVACMLSHLSLYKYGLDNNLNNIWVIEDDVKFLRDPHVLTEILEELDAIDPNWDILYTDLDFMSSKGMTKSNLALPKDKAYPFPQHPLEYYTYRKNVSPNLQLIRYRYATTSMIVSRRGMKKMIHHFTTNDDILWPIDIELHFIPGIRQYGVIDTIATNDFFDFNYSDAGRIKIHTYYDINEENMRYLQERDRLLKDILAHWEEFIKKN